MREPAPRTVGEWHADEAEEGARRGEDAAVVHLDLLLQHFADEVVIARGNEAKR